MKEYKKDTILSKGKQLPSPAKQEECKENSTIDPSSQPSGTSCRNVEKLSVEEKDNTSNVKQPGETHSHLQGNPNTGDIQKCDTLVAPAPIPLFHLSSCLRETFAAVGATHKPYPFREILTLLKTYLYSKRHLFDPNDILYVNCGNDPLGGALGVERFHFNEAKLLVARNILPVQSNPQKHISTCGPTWVKPLPVPASGSSTQERLIDCDSRNDVKYSHVPTARIDTRLELDNANDKTAVPSSDNCLPTTSKTSELGSSAGTCLDLKISQDMQASLSTSPVAGPSRLTAEETASYSKGCPTSGFPSRLVIPSVPESGTDSESAYSCQGYETALCHNTEYEETDDVGVAVLAFHALYESERDFWPDSDTEDESTDDPELVGERWPCLSCGQKNKPFVRYCSKCWHLRKNWLPERPKKCRRRKPRFKNKHKKHKTEAEVPDEQVPTPNRASGNLSKDLENSNSHPPFKDNEQRQSTSDPSGSLTDLSQEVEDDDDLPDVYPSIQSTSTLQTYTKGKSLIRSLGSYQDFSNKLQIEKSPHCQVTATSNSLEGKSER
ncbi:E3 ubiquitin-protein ligase Mdm2-like, partial [Homarus americanus]